jgi:hypothetical protein
MIVVGKVAYISAASPAHALRAEAAPSSQTQTVRGRPSEPLPCREVERRIDRDRLLCASVPGPGP